MFFFFNDTATTEIYTLSLHDALPISTASSSGSLLSLAKQRSSTSKMPAAGTRLLCTSRSEEHTSELQSQSNLVCRLLLEKKKQRPGSTLFSPVSYQPRHATVTPLHDI